MKKHINIPIFVPHLGCPNDCSFCNQKKITGARTTVTAKDVENIVKSHLATINSDLCEVEIGFFGGSFTGIEPKQQEELLGAAYKFLEKGKISGIRLSTRPDYIGETILDRLKKYGVTTVELGVQSMEDAVLKKNMRGHTAKDTILASELIKSYNIGLGHQLMLGLPGDTKETAIKTAKKSIELKPDCVRIYPTLVIRDTMLAHWYENGSYLPLTLKDAVNQCKEILKLLRQADINVIRMGLLSSDNINPDADVLAGPYHPSFGELVESELLYDALCEQIAKISGKSIEISVNPRFVSTLVGCKKENIKRLKEVFSLRDIKIVQDESIKLGNWRVKCI